MAIETQKVDVATPAPLEKGKKKMFLIKTRCLDVLPGENEGFIQFTANGKVYRIPEDEEYWASEIEVESLKNAVAIQHIRTETPDKHQVIVKKPFRRYELTILSEKVVNEEAPAVVQFSEVKTEVLNDEPRNL